MSNGRRAEKQQAWLRAAQYYEQACALRPTDAASCQRAQEMRDYGVEIRTYRARQRCSEGDLAGCIEEFRPLLGVASSRQNLVRQIVDEAGALATTQCAAQSHTISETISELACLQAWQEPLWSGAAFRDGFVAKSRGVAGQLALLADGQPAEGFGARMAYLEAAQCIAPLSAEQRHALEGATASFRTALATPLRLRYTSNGTTRSAPGTCATISESLGRGLQCVEEAPGSSHEPLDVEAEVFVVSPRWQRSHRDTHHVARYQSGTRQVQNPDYDARRLEYELAETRHADTERDMREQERRCNDTQTTSDCDSYESLKRQVSDRQRERDNARSRFHNTPATLTEPVYRDHNYVTRHHEWRAPYRASVKVGNLDWAPLTTQIIYQDTEQAGFSPAGIQADPFEQPSESYFRNRSSSWLTSRLAFRIRDAMAARAKLLMERCKGDRVECWSRARFLNGEGELALATLEILATGQIDPTGGHAPVAEKAVQHEVRCTANLLP